MRFIETTYSQLVDNSEPNLFGLRRERKYFNKAAILVFSPFSFPVPADVRRRNRVHLSSSRMFLLRLVLYKSSGSNILSNGKKTDIKLYTRLRKDAENAMPFGIKRMNIKHRMDCSYYNY